MAKKLLRIVLVLVLLGLLVAGAGAWLAFGPNTPDFEGERSVKIPPESDFEAVVDSLDSSGVLGSERTFSWMARATGWGSQIKAGHYTFESGASNYDLLNKLRRGLQSPVRLTIPPGTSRPEVIAAVAGREMYFEPEAFVAALKNDSLATALGTDTTHLFAYMLPETYFFYWLNDAPTVVRRIKEQFDEFFDAEMQRKAEALGLSVEDVLNLAAIVEWETGVEEEKARIAGVYLNRLERGWPLQADPTVQYAVLEQEGAKRRLLFADYDITHPYNTYQFVGLPPGPVTNPSPSSIRAVINAEDHDYMYFVAKPEGGHAFNTTLAGHNRDANRLRRYLRERDRE